MIEDRALVVGVVTSAILALAPWMFMVHAKLAVLAAKIASMERKVDELIQAHAERLPTCAVHQARLDTLGQQLEDISDRLRQLE